MKKFWILFIGIVGSFYAFTLTDDYNNFIERPLGSLYAFLSTMILKLFGHNIKLEGTLMNGDLFDMNVAHGCDALVPMVMIVTAISLFPFGSVQAKLKGIGWGVFFIFILNLVRLISLYIIGIYAKGMFEFFHVEFWQTVFIIIALIYFIWWMKNKT